MRVAPDLPLFLLVFICSASALFSDTTPAETGRPVVRWFGPRDYQADPLCQAVMQDADGVMLIANNTDALAFDGVTWQPVPLPAASTGIDQLVRGADGVVYAAGGSVLGEFRGPAGRKEYVSLLGLLPGPPTREPRDYGIAAGPDALYCADDSHLWAWREGRFTAVRGAPLPREPQLLAARDAVYVTGVDAPLYRISGDQLVLFADSPLLRRSEPVLVETIRVGELRVLTSGRGFLEVTASGAAPWNSPADRWLAGKRVRSAQRLADGSLAIAFTSASGNGGIRLAADGSFLGAIDESIGLPNRALRDFAVDGEGGWWIGLESGLARVDRPSAVSLFDETNGLHGFVTTVARHHGVLYAATIEGLHRLVPAAAAGRAAHFERLLSGPVYGLLSDSDGLLIRGPRELLRLGDQGVEPLLPLPPAIGMIVRSKRDPQRLWLNSMQGLQTLRRTDRGWRDEGRVAGFSYHAAGFVECDDGSFWISSFDHGLFHVKFRDPDRPMEGTPEIENFTHGAGLPEGFEHCAVYQWAGGPVFYFDRASRPYRFDPDRRRFEPLPGTEAMTAEHRFDCWASEPAPDDLWFVNNDLRPARQTIFRLRAGRGDPQALPHAIADTAGKIWRTIEEPGPFGPVLWICSANGLLRVELTRAFAAPVPLTTILTAGRIAEGARLPAEDTAPTFAFSAPRFQPGASVQFQTRLAGLEPDWSSWSSDPTRLYARLPAASYRFEVRARDADGVVSAPAALGFVLWPPWWKSWWALTLAAIAGAAAIVAATRWFAVRALRRRLALLEAQSAVERERLRLARDLHDEVGSGLGRVILFAGEAERLQAEPAQLTAALGRVRTTAQELVQHAREIVWAVTPQNDNVGSLIERLGDYAGQVLRAAGIGCRLDLEPDPPPLPFSSEARHSVFLAVKEALHNTLKYSGASDVRLEARVAEGWLTIVLADNGCGFAPGERRGSGHGLKNIAIRAEALGGTADVASVAGQGTTVTLRVPLAGGAR